MWLNIALLTQANARHVIGATANEKAEFSNSDLESSDVMTSATNQSVELKRTLTDVGNHTRSVGVKSVNELLTEVFRSTATPRLLPLESCQLKRLQHLKVNYVQL